jgi:mannose-P-dolichol utilization defect protein 1
MESLRSALQPLTHNLPVPVTDFGRNLIGPYCYKTLVLDIDPFTAPDCVKLAVSKGLGIAIVGASSIVKIPQLIKLINSGSAEGISFTSYFLESSAYLISLVYNIRHGFPFSTYGETALILAQNVVISCYVLSYTRRASWVTLWVAGLMLAGAWMWRKDLVPVKTMAWLQAFSGVLGVASKVPQIVTVSTTKDSIDVNRTNRVIRFGNRVGLDS